ncbi:MAG: class IV adenylate cyclase [Terriglobales bacterium]
MPLEIEIKLPITDPPALRRRLRGASFHPGPRRREINWLLDDAAGRFRRAGVLLRLRRSGRQWLLTAKGPPRPSRLKIRPEVEMPLDDGRGLLALLAVLDWRPRLVYERYRTLWRSGGHPGLAVAWDHTPIGNFLELEGPAAAIHRALRQLGFPAAAASAPSYPDLFRRWARRHRHRGREFTFQALRGGRAVSPRAKSA